MMLSILLGRKAPSDGGTSSRAPFAFRQWLRKPALMKIDRSQGGFALILECVDS
jgi:hypothetical protein